MSKKTLVFLIDTKFRKHKCFHMSSPRGARSRPSEAGGTRAIRIQRPALEATQEQIDSFFGHSHTNTTTNRWHLWEMDVRFAPGLPPGWMQDGYARFEQSDLPAHVRQARPFTTLDSAKSLPVERGVTVSGLGLATTLDSVNPSQHLTEGGHPMHPPAL